MSFSIEFNAETAVQARAILLKEHAPDCVKAFLDLALSGLSAGPVSVKAVGHLYDGPYSYNISTANIEVKPLVFKTL